MSHDLKFSQDWNNKLTGPRAFSTIRIWSEEKHKLGQYYNVYLKDKIKEGHCAELVAARPVMYKNITEAMAWLDSGYPLQPFLAILNKVYASYIREQGDTALFGHYVFVWRNKEAVKAGQKDAVQNYFHARELQEA